MSSKLCLLSDAAFGAVGRYDLRFEIESMTVAQFLAQRSSMIVEYGFANSPFGECMVAGTDRGICSFRFAIDGQNVLVDALKEQWSGAQIVHNNSIAEDVMCNIFEHNGDSPSVKLLLIGTPFQITVWRGLSAVSFGKLVSYSDLASYVGMSRGVRAVASAVGRNPIGYIIPCHRVIRGDSTLGGFYWGLDLKAVIIAYEQNLVAKNCSN